MCGIAGIYIKDSHQKAFEKHSDIELIADALLAGIEVRGRDATGVVSVAVGSKVPVIEKADIQASKFIHWRSPIAHNPRMVLLHSRLATKGSPANLCNNHPVQYGSTFVTHNGVIMNDDELFDKHNLERIGQVDTEIIPALLDKYGFDKVNVALKELDGSYAIAACDPVRSPDHLILAKGSGSPLEYMETDELIIWASTKTIIDNAWHVLTGKKASWSDLKSLRYAELLAIGPKSVEKFDFPVFEKKYTSSNYNMRDFRGSEGWDWDKDPCICGDSKSIHAGRDDDGQCLRANCKCARYVRSDRANGKDHPLKELCRSGNFINIKESTTQEQDEREGWGQQEYFVTEDDGINTYAVCIGCSQAELIEDMNPMFGYWFCDLCAADDPEEKETDDEKDKVKDFDAAIVETAKDLSLKPEYVHWILFESDDKDFDKDPSLVSAYCACDDLYSSYVESFIGRGVSEIDREVPRAALTAGPEVGL